MNLQYDTYIVSPGYESHKHFSGLHADTRLRLFVTALAFKKDKTKKIIVSGGKIRKMKKSFAELKKDELIKNLNIPAEVIETEEETFDTSSQIIWIKNNIEKLGSSIAFITDPFQAKHVQILLNSYNLPNVKVLTVDKILFELDPENFHFYTNLYNSIYGYIWRVREFLITQFTKFFDPKGKIIQKITRYRLPKN